MAPLARKATPATRRAGLPSFVTLLFLLVTLLQGTGANTCEEQDLACLDSEVCTACTIGFEPGTECAEYDFDEANTCPHGVSYCCAAKAEGLEICLNDLVTQEYLECNLVALGCSLSDMPCFELSVVDSGVGDAEERSSSSVDVLSSAAPRGASTAGVAAAVAAAVALAVFFTPRSSADSFWGL